MLCFLDIDVALCCGNSLTFLVLPSDRESAGRHPWVKFPFTTYSPFGPSVKVQTINAIFTVPGITYF